MGKMFRGVHIKLAEAVINGGWIQLLKEGKFFDTRYGELEITRKMFAEMIINFEKGVRGIVPMVDFKHETDGEAAAWFKEVATRNDGSELWGRVDWTVLGNRKLDEKAYAYVSPDFDEDYVCNETLEKHGCVLLGAALTNRPVIKKMASVIQLSEHKPGELQMNEEEMKAKIAELEKKLAEYMKLMEGMGEEDMAKLAERVKMMEHKEETTSTKLEETNKMLAETKTQLTESNKKLSEGETKLKDMGKEVEFSVMLSEASVVPAQKAAFLKGDMAEFAKNAGSINIEEKGSGKGHEDKDADEAMKRVVKLTEDKSEGDKITLLEARKIVLSENPKLAKQLSE